MHRKWPILVDKKKTDNFSSVFRIKRKLHHSKIGWWDACIKKGRFQFLTPYVQTQKREIVDYKMLYDVFCSMWKLLHQSFFFTFWYYWCMKKKKDWSHHEQIIRKILRCLFVANTSHFSTLSLKVHLSCNPSIFYRNASWCFSIIWVVCLEFSILLKKS